MSYRVVIPRSIPFGDSNRVQQAMWRRGYSTRLAGRDTVDHGRVVVEFLRVVSDLPEPGAVGGLAAELESALSAKAVHAEFAGHGAWLETIQRPLKRTA